MILMPETPQEPRHKFSALTTLAIPNTIITESIMAAIFLISFISSSLVLRHCPPQKKIHFSGRYSTPSFVLPVVTGSSFYIDQHLQSGKKY